MFVDICLISGLQIFFIWISDKSGRNEVVLQMQQSTAGSAGGCAPQEIVAIATIEAHGLQFPFFVAHVPQGIPGVFYIIGAGFCRWERLSSYLSIFVQKFQLIQ